MPRREFPARIKAAAALRANGHCEECSRWLMTGDFHFDHEIPDGLGGEPTLENCKVLCRSCHGAKTTTEDVPRISKAKRNYRTSHGIKKSRKITSWRRFSGEIVRAPRER
jgi:5-methylcytosine-specific restriction endonuclease McrA